MSDNRGGKRKGAGRKPAPDGTAKVPSQPFVVMLGSQLAGEFPDFAAAREFVQNHVQPDALHIRRRADKEAA